MYVLRHRFEKFKGQKAKGMYTLYIQYHGNNIHVCQIKIGYYFQQKIWDKI